MLVPSIFSNNFVDDIFDDVFPFGAYNAPAADNRAAMNTDVKEFERRIPHRQCQTPGQQGRKRQRWQIYP